MNDEARKSVGIVGLGVAACAVCCAGPLIAFLGALGVAGIASTFLIGGFGLVLAAAAAAGYMIVRRRRITCALPAEPIAVAAPSRRTPTTTESR